MSRPPERSLISSAAEFLRKDWWIVALVSLALMIPCFWHAHLAAGDLASHTYNAWLAQLIHQGNAPRLWLATQWNNVLFDYCLSAVASVVGLHAGEKIAVAFAVLLFFWGAFAFIAALTRRVPWFIAPALAAFAYGWTFEQGFMNYYMSLGLAFFGLAAIAAARGREIAPAMGFAIAIAVAIALLAWLAHPLGCILLVAMGAYIFLANRLGKRARWALFAAALVALLAVHFYLAHYFNVVWNTGPLTRKLLRFNGTDQLITYGAQYRLVANAMLAFILICVGVELYARLPQRPPESVDAPWSLEWQLYAIAFAAAFLLPRVLYLPQMLGPQVGLLTERLTSVTAVLALCVVSAARPRKWHLAGFAIVAAIFFSYLYLDTGTLNGMETQAENLVRQLPADQRVVATIWPLPGSRVLIDHFVDRACIGQCYSYGNYEPSSGQFRVRARPDNGIVVANFEDTDAIESGMYVVQPQDLPLYEIYQCQPDWIGLCIRPLVAGERNGSIGYRPAQFR